MVDVALGPLAQQAAQELADTLAVRHPLPQRLRQVVTSKAEGNPLFVEELVRMLFGGLSQPANVAVDEVTLAEIPDTLHGLLLARIDRLPETARRLLRVAAVIGREFPAALLDEVAAQEANEDPPARQLGQLEAAGLLGLITVRPEPVYAFRHALIQDAAYGSLLRNERRRLHGVVGEVPERLSPQRRGELAAQLARHFEQAGRPDPAARYQLEAGEQALRRFANPQALDFLEKAATQAARAGNDDQSLRFRLATLLALGEAAGQTATSQQRSPPLPRRPTSPATGGTPRRWPKPRSATARPPTSGASTTPCATSRSRSRKGGSSFSSSVDHAPT